MSGFETYFGKEFKMIVDDEVVDVQASEFTKDLKLVILYFSAHWCPPCRSTTPILIKLYKQIQEEKLPVEVIFCSFDHGVDEWENYYKTMPWKAFPSGDKRYQDLANLCHVTGIPGIVVMKPDGTIINEEARSELTNPKALDQVKEWIK